MVGATRGPVRRPSLAPSISPGMSADHQLVRRSSMRTTSEAGVPERRAGIVGDLRLGGGDAERSACDLPTLGKPTSATSAISLQLQLAATAPRSSLPARRNSGHVRRFDRRIEWASTMLGNVEAEGVVAAHPDASRLRITPHSVTRQQRELAEDLTLAPGATRSGGAGTGPPQRTRPRPHLFRPRPRPHPARHRVPSPGRQDPGVHLPRRPPAHPPHPRSRSPRSPRRSRAPWGQRGPHRGHRPGPRLWPRSRWPRLRGRFLPYVHEGLRPCRVGSRRGPRATQPVRGDPRRHPQPLLVPAAAGHPRGRDRVLGRPDRVRLPRLRGRGPRRNRVAGHAARWSAYGVLAAPRRGSSHVHRR